MSRSIQYTSSPLLASHGLGSNRGAKHGMQDGALPIARLALISPLKQSEHGDSF